MTTIHHLEWTELYLNSFSPLSGFTIKMLNEPENKNAYGTFQGIF